MSTLFRHVPKVTTLSIINSTIEFPIRRVFCIGKNYLDHVKEQRVADEKTSPVVFYKPADAIIDTNKHSVIPYPPVTKNLHYEIELVIAIGKNGKNILNKDAMDYVFGYAIGIDLTARDLQNEAKLARGPWDLSKGCKLYSNL
jgi:fumarylpyruvate hydrolase